jgi:hypothetical protein
MTKKEIESIMHMHSSHHHSRQGRPVQLSWHKTHEETRCGAHLENLSLIELMKEAKEMTSLINLYRASVQHCKLLKDNAGAMKMYPLPKCLNIKYPHCCKYVQLGLSSAHAVSTNQQIADILTEPLPINSFKNHCQ